MARLFSGKPFDPIAERAYYSRKPALKERDAGYLEPYYRVFLGDYLACFKGRRILDIGAGECLHGKLICAKCQPQLYVNLDLFIERMQVAIGHNIFREMFFVAGNNYTLPFKGSSFDVVWGGGILFRLRPLISVVQEISRVLSNSGVYYGVEPNFANPMVILKFSLMSPRDPNDRILSHTYLHRTFGSAGMELELRPFWARLPWLRNSFFSPAVGLVARKVNDRVKLPAILKTDES